MGIARKKSTLRKPKRRGSCVAIIFRFVCSNSSHSLSQKRIVFLSFRGVDLSSLGNPNCSHHSLCFFSSPINDLFRRPKVPLSLLPSSLIRCYLSLSFTLLFFRIQPMQLLSLFYDWICLRPSGLLAFVRFESYEPLGSYFQYRFFYALDNDDIIRRFRFISFSLVISSLFSLILGFFLTVLLR